MQNVSSSSSNSAWVALQVGLEPDQFCKSGTGLPEALKTEPLEADKLSADLQADHCVQMALRALHSAPPPKG